MELVEKYFSELDASVKNNLKLFCDLIVDWNTKVNVISRKDIEHLESRHLIPSLSFMKVVQFLPGSHIMDVGTGGGFPGVPLAICNPEVDFYLVDSVGKKIKVIQSIVDELKLPNVHALNARVESVGRKFDFILGRAVTNLPTFLTWVEGKVKGESIHAINNGILYLKGGDLEEDLNIKPKAIYPLDKLLDESFDAQGKYITYFSDF